VIEDHLAMMLEGGHLSWLFGPYETHFNACFEQGLPEQSWAAILTARKALPSN
jgi:hypothetical protein